MGERERNPMWPPLGDGRVGVCSRNMAEGLDPPEGSQASGEAGRGRLMTEGAKWHAKVTLKSQAGFQQALRGG